MKNKIVYYALGAVALYYLYDWYKKKQPVQTILPGTNVMQAPVQQNTNLLPSSPVQNELAPGLTIVTDLINTTQPPVKVMPTYQEFYGETLNGVKVGKVPMTC